ncbi:tight adherence pilus pseudopilin TadF [Apirhabdus apintestini]|uniref:tight adherence pilus pseudopilin TadF n=1 Tax=Erwinia sp. HR93 TaxID=3094840 RepID=UPI002ADEDD94|nr:tight adherence pilus pseudopilin TadF [Erwinia sp. HR93]MEA1062999.1 tight adherence pilus pseudopilin TadF [Erwinia sp. HR93]WPM84880.1 tight adherence pilus pseudopilin TadF [Enterobacteriaceae bacterium CA-0114]
MFRNTNVHNLWTRQDGAVAVEFALIAIFLAGFIAFTSELAYRQSMIGKLDRIAYSLAGIMRERTQFFNGIEDDIRSQHDLGYMRNIAERILKDTGYPYATDEGNLKINLQRMTFDYAETNNKAQRVGHLHTWYYPGCAASDLPVPMEELSPYSTYNRWVTVYRVTVCLRDHSILSWFKPAKGMLTAHAIAVAR